MRSFGAAALGLTLACGPTTAAGTGEASTSETDGTTTSTASTTSTTSGGSATTSTTTHATSETSEATTSSSSEAGSDDAYEEDTGAGGCAFTCPAPPGGGGGGGGTVECDVWAQDCPEDQKCMPWANDGGLEWNATRCSPLDPEWDELDEPCTVEGSAVSGIDSCGVSLICWDVDPRTNAGVCAALCQGSSANPQCPGDDECVEQSELLPLCVDGCDPLAQDCPADEACAPELGPLVCSTAGPSLEGDPCDAGCSAGTTCVDGSYVAGCTALACCTSWCDPSGMPCPGLSDCVPLDAHPELGLCVLP